MSFVVVSSSSAVAALVAVLVVGISTWIPFSKRRWQHRLTTFIEHHKQDAPIKHNRNQQSQKDILLIVNPASGGGKSIKLYPTIVKAFRTTRRSLDVHITTSSEEMKFLTQSALLKDHISKYKVIAIMGGDSSITEFVQHTLQTNNGKWPHAPILHLPAGTGNAISSECFGTNTSVEDIVEHGLIKSRKACVLRIASPSMSTPCYALHNCFDGVQRHMLETLDKSRAYLYPAFGGSIVMPIILASLFTLPKEGMKPIPYILAIVTDTEGLGMKLGFGLNRYDDQMMVLHVTKWPGPFQFLKIFQKFMSGQLGKDFHQGNWPDWIYMEKTKEFALQPPPVVDENRKDNSTVDVSANKNSDEKNTSNIFHMYLDGGGIIPCQGTLTVNFKVIPAAIPYFVHDGIKGI